MIERCLQLVRSFAFLWTGFRDGTKCRHEIVVLRSYLPSSDLVSGMAANTDHAWERIYEPDRDLIATVHNRFGDRTISRFDYTNDAIGRRITRVDSSEAFSETAFEHYAYNDRSEVIGSQRFYGSDITDLSHPVTGRSFGYGYDSIGNRVSSFEDVGGERLETTYTANELNQYTAIQNASAVPLRGDAKRDAVVTVNGDRAERDNGTASFTPWSYALPSSNSNASFQHADILAVAQSATGEDGEQRESGSVFVPAEETLLTYDDDGNMTFDGRFRYSWNGENRMIRAEEAVVPTNRAPTIITYAYDEQGRMVSKNIAGTNTVARSLLWDGYNIVREVENGTPTYNVWGLDLDGSLQGCGGVGGLLAVSKTNALHLAFYDANGNISEYVSPSGSISAHYQYSPFGIPLLSQGPSFTHQFSTKPYCRSTGLSEYQLRKYSPILGRWMSRDPLNESTDIGLFLACNNNLIFDFDINGGIRWKSLVWGIAHTAASAVVVGVSIASAVATGGLAAAGSYAVATVAALNVADGIKEVFNAIEERDDPAPVIVDIVNEASQITTGNPLSPKGAQIVTISYHVINIATACFQLSAVVKTGLQTGSLVTQEMPILYQLDGGALNGVQLITYERTISFNIQYIEDGFWVIRTGFSYYKLFKNSSTVGSDILEMHSFSEKQSVIIPPTHLENHESIIITR